MLLATVLVGGLLAGLVAALPTGVARAATPTAPRCATQATDERTALTIADQCDQQVEVVSARTEVSQVFAEPSGLQTMRTAAEPQRVHNPDGSWSPISTKLARQDDGSLAPRATVADVRFSGGGSGPFVTWRAGGADFTLSWPAPLPEPRLDGDTAVYDNVLPGANLHVTATADGFRHALELTTPAAAKQEAARQIRYIVGGTMATKTLADGSLELRTPAGEVIGSTAPAGMWDSTITAHGVSDPDGELRSDARRPGATAQAAPVAVAFAGRDLTVTPAAAMLDAAATEYPVWIDPPFNGLRGKWAYASSTNHDASHNGESWVGKNPYDGVTYRTYFEFGLPDYLKGSKIFDSHIEALLNHSWSCDSTPVTLWRTWGITVDAWGARMNWGDRPLNTNSSHPVATWSGHANEAGGCSKIEPDALAVFEGGALTADLQYAVNFWDTYTVGLCACDFTDDSRNESVQARWKKFYSNKTYLVMTYDHTPNAPVAQPLSTVTDCYKVCGTAAVVRTRQPTLRASVSDRDGGNLSTVFEIRWGAKPEGSTYIASNYDAPVTTGSPGTASWKSDVQLGIGATYWWRAVTKDENGLEETSPWYTVTIDVTAPPAPTVASTQYPLKEWGSTVGTAGSFALTGSADSVDYGWSVNSGPSATVSGGPIAYTPATDMVKTMQVFARDAAGNRSPDFNYQFWVRPVENRCWNWRLDEATGTNAADSGNSRPEDAICGPIGSTVAAQTATLSGAVKFGPGYVNGAASFTGAGQIATAGPVLDTSKSFTVMAWVRPSDLGAGEVQTAVSQDGTANSRFALGYRKDANGGRGGWCFELRGSDVAGAPASRACATGAVMDSHPPAAGKWVHLGGVYDAVTKKLQVHVMGNQESCSGEMVTADAAGEWAASGPFVIGRAQDGAAAVASWRGDIDQVYAHQRVLRAVEICQQAAA